MKLPAIILLLCNYIISTYTSEYLLYPGIDKYYKFHRNTKTWYEAVETCRQENATLAMPQDEAEAMVLANILNQYPTTMLSEVIYNNYMYLGFHDIFAEGEFVDLHGKSIQYNYHTWNNGQPDNANNNEDCGSLHRVGKINDLPCNAKCVFVCEKRNNPKKDCGKTDLAYVHSNELNMCYKFHINPRIWSVARAICEAEGSTLAIIRSKAQEDFLVQMFNDPANKVTHVTYKDFAFIGFHDLYQNKKFMTVLDEHLDDIGYIHWATGQPDNSGGNEHCGSIHLHGGINDLPCSTSVPFICERPATENS